MVTRSKAFTTAFKILTYSFIFWIAGVILIFSGYRNPILLFFSRNTAVNFLGYLPSLIFVLIGGGLILLGSLASNLKFLTELINEESKHPNPQKEPEKVYAPLPQQTQYRPSPPPQKDYTKTKEPVSEPIKQIDKKKLIEGASYCAVGVIGVVLGYWERSFTTFPYIYYVSNGMMIAGIIVIIYGLYLILSNLIKSS